MEKPSAPEELSAPGLAGGARPDDMAEARARVLALKSAEIAVGLRDSLASLELFQLYVRDARGKKWPPLADLPDLPLPFRVGRVGREGEDDGGVRGDTVLEGQAVTELYPVRRTIGLLTGQFSTGHWAPREGKGKEEAETGRYQARLTAV